MFEWKGQMPLTHIEKKALSAFYEKEPSIYSMVDSKNLDDWLCFGLFTLLQAGLIVRKVRLESMQNQVSFKPDGSPVTKADKTVEIFLKESCLIIFLSS